MKLTKEKVQALFLNDYGKPYTLTQGQVEIFNAVYDPEISRAAIRALTQYGKSEVTALALITAATMRKEKILIVAPSSKQAGIIMSYIIIHLFDNDIFKRAIEWWGSLEILKQERSKKRITLTNGSEFFILTSDVRTVSQEARNVMGFGATMVIVDESSLIPDTMFSKIFRMVGGVKDGKMVQLGNPFERNHFKRAFDSPRYKKIIIDWKQALKEGRITQEFIDEAKDELRTNPIDFDIFYNCKFPDEGAENSLIPADWVDKAVEQKVPDGEVTAGLDVARFGKDKTVYYCRNGGRVVRLEVVGKRDTMEVVGWVRTLIEKDKPTTLSVDVVGLGAGVYDRLRELEDENEINCEILGINVGEKPTGQKQEVEKFYNLKSQMFWKLGPWFKPENGKSGVSIPNDSQLIEELKALRYSYFGDRKIRIESKEKMKLRIGRSPDRVDALMLAFSGLTKPRPSMVVF